MTVLLGNCNILLLILLMARNMSGKAKMPYQEIDHMTLQGEWPSDLYSLRQVTEVKLGQVTSNSGWVTSEAWPRNSPRRPSSGTLN